MQSSCTSKMVKWFFIFLCRLTHAGAFLGARAAPGAFFCERCFFIPFTPIKILICSFDALTPSGHFAGRAGPLLFCSCRKVSKRQAQGSFTPLRIPGPKWGAGRPPLETPKSRYATRIGRTPRRFAAGASAPLGKAASACALATAAAPPPLRVGGFAPGPPRFPIGKHLLVMCERAWYRVRNGFCSNAFANLPEAPAPKERGVPLSPRANCGRRPRQRAKENFKIWGSGGNPKGGAALFGQSLPTFCWPESRGPARPAKCPEGVSASKELIRILIGVKGINKASRAKSPKHKKRACNSANPFGKTNFLFKMRPRRLRERTKNFPPPGWQAGADTAPTAVQPEARPRARNLRRA